MNSENQIDETELPVSGAIRVQRRRGYGSILDLDDEAPADVAELERLIAWQQYGPILALPDRYGRGARLVLNAQGEIDWDRMRPAGGRRVRRASPDRQGAQQRAELARVLGLIGLLNQRVPGTARYLVLKYVRMGVLELEHVTNHDLRQLVKLEAKARQLRDELAAVARPARRCPPERRPTALAVRR